MRIVLVCSGGMTTSVLARGMQELVIDRLDYGRMRSGVVLDWALGLLV